MSGPGWVATADFNGDGKVDLATADHNVGSGGVSVFLGNGDGTLKARQPLSAGLGTTGVATGDFNDDGRVDLVTADWLGDTVSVLLGNGDGTFGASQSFSAGPDPRTVYVADYNGDGKLDLATAQYVQTTTVDLLLGNGDGTFGASQPFTTTVTTDDGIITTAPGDFNGDGIDDLVTADYFGGTISVQLQNTTLTTLGPLGGISVATRAEALAAQGRIDTYLKNVNTVAGAIGAAMSRFETAASTLSSTSAHFTVPFRAARTPNERTCRASVSQPFPALHRG